MLTLVQFLVEVFRFISLLPSRTCSVIYAILSINYRIITSLLSGVCSFYHLLELSVISICQAASEILLYVINLLIQLTGFVVWVITSACVGTYLFIVAVIEALAVGVELVIVGILSAGWWFVSGIIRVLKFTWSVSSLLVEGYPGSAVIDEDGDSPTSIVGTGETLRRPYDPFRIFDPVVTLLKGFLHIFSWLLSSLLSLLSYPVHLVVSSVRLFSNLPDLICTWQFMIFALFALGATMAMYLLMRVLPHRATDNYRPAVGQDDDDDDDDDFERTKPSEQELRKRLADERASKKCVVCMVRDKTVLLMPCRHLCLCARCADQIMRGMMMRACPVCRGLIINTYNVYT